MLGPLPIPGCVRIASAGSHRQGGFCDPSQWTRVPGSAGERPANHARILHRRRDEKLADIFFVSLLALLSSGILVDSCLAEFTRRVAKWLDLRRVSAKSA